MTQTEPKQVAGHLLVECLLAQGVTHAFGVPGESYLAVLDGFHAYGDRIRFITCRQEGGAAFMADAQGRLSGRPGVCFVTRGPGATNASVGIHNAFQDSTPMVLFVGDVGSDFRGREAFQELNFACFFGPSTGGMAKHVERIDDPQRIPECVARAFAMAMNGRPGPVVVVLPEDMLRSEVHARPLARVEPVRAACDQVGLGRLRDLLRESKRPVVIVGGGGWTVQSAQALQRFAENWQLPVANAFRCQDLFDNRHAQYAGDVGIAINPRLAKRIEDSDLILTIGARLGEMTTQGYALPQAPRPHQKLVHIHACAQELNRVYQADLAVLSTMNAAATSLEGLEPPEQIAWTDWTRQAHADYLANLHPQTLPGDVDMHAVIESVNRLLPSDAVMTNGAGNFASWLHRYFRHAGLAHGQRVQLAPSSGTMGYGVPAGIAASLLTGRTVFTITGDGDFLMNGQELATAVQYGAKTIVVLLNNGMYGTIRMHQERDYPQRLSGTSLRNPDFVSLAKAYGYTAQRVQTTAEFEPALRAALSREGGTLIEIMLNPEVITTRASLTSIRERALQSSTR